MATQLKLGIGKHVFNVVEDFDGSHVEFSKVDTERTPWRRKMNGHWAGVELGVNMFRDADYSMYGNPGFGEFMDLHQAKSLSVNINFLEFVFSNERNNFGLVTGMGLSSMNFRFGRTHYFDQRKWHYISGRYFAPKQPEKIKTQCCLSYSSFNVASKNTFKAQLFTC